MIYKLALGFIENYCEVTLVASESFKPKIEECYNFEIIFLKDKIRQIFKSNLIPFHPELFSLLTNREKEFDLIISSECFSLDTLIASLVIPKKIIIWQELNKHNNFCMKIPSKIWYNIVVRFIYKNINIIARSQQAKNFISNYSNNVSCNIVDHGVNVHKFNISDVKKKQFISIAQLIYRKNIDGIIDKFSRFIKDPRFCEFKLYLAGRGDQEHYLRDKVNKLNLDQKVIFLGFMNQSDLNKYVSESYAYLINTRKDLKIGRAHV